MKTFVLILLMVATGLQAQNNPVAFPSDARVKHVIYQDNDVVPIKGMIFTTTQIQFGEKEEVLDIEGGDSAAWMVTHHPELANTLFVKPTLLDSNTNLTIITNQHAYYFHLSSHKHKELEQTYAVKFIYPAQAKKPIPAKENTLVHPKVSNVAYRFSGSPQLVPKHVFDDGRFTYFEFSSLTVPAIFAVEDKQGKESIVNTRQAGPYLIVHRIAPQFTLRQGGFVTSVFNTQEIQRIAANRRPE
jgi:type IV secretion system protein VirB9